MMACKSHTSPHEDEQRTKLDLRGGHVDHGQQVQQLLVAGAALRRCMSRGLDASSAASQDTITHAAGQAGWQGLTSLMKPRIALQHLCSMSQGAHSATGHMDATRKR